MTETTQHTSTSGRPETGAERFCLEADELRFVADWVHASDPIWVEVPTEVAGLIRLRRAESAGCY
jgi:hypothetical protein